MMTRMQFLRSVAILGAGACGFDTSPGPGNKPEVDAAAPPIDAPECMTANGASSRCVPPVDASIDASAPVTCSSTSAVVGDNHGHSVVVSDADVTAGVAKMYDIRGVSGHPHTITITAAMFAQLKTHVAITVTSTEDAGHAHDVVVTCAG